MQKTILVCDECDRLTADENGCREHYGAGTRRRTIEVDDTITKSEKNDRFEEWLNAAPDTPRKRKPGRPGSHGHRVTLAVQVTHEQKLFLEEWSRRDGLSVAEIIRRWIGSIATPKKPSQAPAPRPTP